MVFSTNINPRDLVDDAALRRLRYKILVDKPDMETLSRSSSGRGAASGSR